MHGVGAATTRAVFAAAGFAEPVSVPEQDAPDPRFPTVAFPNPEEPGAVDLLVALAERTGADVAIAEDPDADRCSVVCGGRQLTGDEVGALLADWLLRRGVRGTYAASLVSGSLMHVLAAAAGHAVGRDADRVQVDHPRRRRRRPAGLRLRGGAGLRRRAATSSRDKDGISAALAVALLAAELKATGRTLTDRLDELAAGARPVRHRAAVGAGRGPVADLRRDGPAARAPRRRRCSAARSPSPTWR